MNDEEREIARLRAIELLDGIAERIIALDDSLPELCNQMLFENKGVSEITEAVKQHALLIATHKTMIIHFERIILTDSVQLGRELFFGTLDMIKESKVVTADDIELLEGMDDSSDPVIQEAMIEIKRRAAH